MPSALHMFLRRTHSVRIKPNHVPILDYETLLAGKQADLFCCSVTLLFVARVRHPQVPSGGYLKIRALVAKSLGHSALYFLLSFANRRVIYIAINYCTVARLAMWSMCSCYLQAQGILASYVRIFVVSPVHSYFPRP
jgi:hypothetical protein